MNIYSIGFTQKNAEKFFGLIKNESVDRVLDVRINNRSQLSGFAKKDDLAFFLKELCAVDYEHIPDLAPTKDMLSKYKKKDMCWDEYSEKFLTLMSHRKIETIDKKLFSNSCLLCSEHKPHMCHRKLVTDYLNESWGGGLEVKHLY